MTKTEIKTSIIIDKIKNWMDNFADGPEVAQMYCLLFPVECEKMLSDGINRCRNKSDEKCIECIQNNNCPFLHAEGYTKDHYEQFERVEK